MPKDSTPRGIKNNNPGNIERNARDKWQGLAAKQTDRRFLQFTDAVYGIRAIARILITYQDKYKVTTLLGAIKKWAPAPENNPTGYAQAISQRCGIDTGGVIDFHAYAYLRPIVEGIIRQENGQQPYTPAQLDQGLALAGVLPPKKSIAASGTVQAGTAAAVTTTGAGVVETLQGAADQVSSLTPYLDVAKYVFLGLTLAAIGYMVYRRWDDARRLAR